MWVADFREQIELRLIEFLEQEQSEAPSVEARLMLSRISSLILRAGKRFRPSLMFTTYIAYGGKDPKSLINLGLAIELYHQALLIHDDIIDEDFVRYDGPNVVGYYKQDRRFKDTKIPQSMGVLAGDMLLTLCSKVILNDPGFTLKQKTKILELISQTTIGVVYGQQLDSISTIIKPSNFKEKNMILVDKLKSALYTTQLPMRLAAIILDLPEAEVKRMDEFSMPFGIYFQLVDDYADYFVSNTKFDSHPKFRDYPQKKITYPYYVAMKLASDSKIEFLNEHFGDKTISDELKKKVVEALENCGADEATKIFSERYYEEAVSAIKRLSLSQKRKSQFKQLLDDIKI